MFSETSQEMSSWPALSLMQNSAETELQMLSSANNISHPTRPKDSALQRELLRAGDDER
jgi:hypothetical protein